VTTIRRHKEIIIIIIIKKLLQHFDWKSRREEGDHLENHVADGSIMLQTGLQKQCIHLAQGRHQQSTPSSTVMFNTMQDIYGETEGPFASSRGFCYGETISYSTS
jgi:hypothetical protein